MSHKAVLVPVGDMPRIVEVETYKDIQRYVGGNIEPCSWVFDDAPSVYVNEEGKFTCRPNRAIYATDKDAGKVTWDGKKIKEGDLLDILFGDFVCIGFDPETGEDRDISDDEIQLVIERFGSYESIDSGVIETLKIQLGAAGDRA
ncbi:Domain of uncharacterised function (DUF3846) [Slackia heliotrinireducens]|uniref:DUF3846 domain-containing protein n=1 Tax=Slackia heliotrinireducens (strain ATCC 29202 / DSM 20476 / NCTC 11029 / RHS 1) TaxID=471855 RepID=C7N7Z8_SLAHD|nr:DUF3846 domain-containing protein [Slackia heliotrinireducens]ACV23033.1 hypothetical protein Shel_20190 [Slackia heliotrinireducens DSM 20476]VEH01955.1 Domain of uncharacterised function (DUF3846) [Slackia heliotrinireducens]